MNANRLSASDATQVLWLLGVQKTHPFYHYEVEQTENGFVGVSIHLVEETLLGFDRSRSERAYCTLEYTSAEEVVASILAQEDISERNAEWLHGQTYRFRAMLEGAPK